MRGEPLRRRVVHCSTTPTSGLALQPVAVHLTGFGPFGGVQDNPTSIICKRLKEYVEEGKAPGGVSKALLEEFASAGVQLRGLDTLEVSAEACKENVPVIVESLTKQAGASALVHLGVSGVARHICLECRGVNEADFRIPDVRGCQTRGEPVVASAEPVLYTPLRLPEVLGELRDRGVSCEISTDAGRYICNYIFFTSLHAAQPSGIPVLFVHVPPFEVMSCPEQITAVICILLAIARQLRGLQPAAHRAGAVSAKPLG